MPLDVGANGELQATVRVGETLRVFLHFSNDGRDIDLSGATFEQELRYGPTSGSDEVNGVDLVVGIEDASRGLAVVSLPPAKTRLLLPRLYYGEVRATLAGGDVHGIQLLLFVQPTLITA